MKRFAFISRHQPTTSQQVLAEKAGVELVSVGDADAFTVTPQWVESLDPAAPYAGVVVVHPAAAMRLADEYPVGVFENANRAPIGEKPQFEAVSFVIFDRITGDKPGTLKTTTVRS